MSDIDTDPDVGVSTPAASGSPLAHLIGKIAVWREEAYIDLQVPRSHDPAVWVRYGTMPHSEIKSIFRRNEKRGKGPKGVKDWEVRANAEFLVEACLGIYLDLDGEKYPFDANAVGPVDLDELEEDDLPRFDWRAATLLKELAHVPKEHVSAVDVVKTLYVTDGDLLATGDAVMRHCGYDPAGVQERLAGE